jgi:hypothetical protein
MPLGTEGDALESGASVAGGALFMLVGATASLALGGAQGLGGSLSACFKSAAFCSGPGAGAAAVGRTQLESSAV